MLDSKQKGRVAAGVVGIFLSIGYAVEATKLPLGSPESPGPGAFPLVVGVAAALISVIVVIQAAFTRDVSGEIGFPRGDQLRKSLLFLGATAAMVLLLPFLGQYVVGSVYLVLMIRWLGDKTPWLTSILCGVSAGLLISWLFIGVFGVPMPLGVFEF